MSVSICYLIGGAPLSGKTTLSNLWAAKHQATQISTDSIRAWMRRLVRPEDYPGIFTGINMGVEEYFRQYDTAQKIFDQQIAEGKYVEKGISAFLQCDLTIERLIIEGIAITPESALALRQEFPNIQFETTFLFDDNAERIRQRIYERGLWGPRDSYPDNLKDKEVEWVVMYNDFYKTEAQKHQLPLLNIDSLQEG